MRLRRATLPLLLTTLIGLAGLGRAGEVWPTAPAAEAPETLDAAELADYRYAAGLYRSLVEALAGSNTALMPSAQARRLARALLVLGDAQGAAAKLKGRGDLPVELALQIALGADPSAWSARERRRWEQTLRAEDGESLYWRGRLAAAIGDAQQARELLGGLLRKDPSSIFAPPALELLQTLPPAAPAAVEAAAEAAQSDGPRVQWGVFSDARGARRLRDALAAYGETAELLAFRRDGTELYRVCSRPLGDDAAVRDLGDRYRERYGLDYVLFRPAAEGSSP